MKKWCLSLCILLTTSLTLHAQTPTPASLIQQIQGLLTQLSALVSPPPPPPSVIIVKPGDNIQAIVNAAVPGTTIRMTPGATWQSFTLPNKGVGVAPIIIRPDVDDALLPVPGPRSTPTSYNPATMFTIAPTPGTNYGVWFNKGAGPYTLIGMHVTSPTATGTMISIGDDVFATMADVPHGNVIDRCILDGGNAAKRGISENGANDTIINSDIFGVFETGQDTQAIGGSRGPGPYTVLNNYLSASGETVIWGGDDTKLQGVIPSNIVMRFNYITKDLAWKLIPHSVKNVVEFKNAQHVIFEFNTVENTWVDAQQGWLLVLTVRDQNGTNPWATLNDVTVRSNVFRHGNQGVDILGLDDSKSSAGVIYTSVRASGLTVTNNLWYDVGGPTWGGGSGTRAVVVNNGPINTSYTHNTVVGVTGGFLGMSMGLSKTASVNLQVTCNVFPEGKYGLTGDGVVGFGAPSWLADVDPTSLFDYNAIYPTTTGNTWKYPGVNTRLAPMTFATQFIGSPELACADGKSAGADVASLIAGIPGLDLSK